MRRLNVKLWRNDKEQNWSVDIDGESYKFISLESVKELVTRALADTQESMIKEATRPRDRLSP